MREREAKRGEGGGAGVEETQKGGRAKGDFVKTGKREKRQE